MARSDLEFGLCSGIMNPNPNVKPDTKKLWFMSAENSSENPVFVCRPNFFPKDFQSLVKMDDLVNTVTL